MSRQTWHICCWNGRFAAYFCFVLSFNILPCISDRHSFIWEIVTFKNLSFTLIKNRIIPDFCSCMWVMYPTADVAVFLTHYRIPTVMAAPFVEREEKKVVLWVLKRWYLSDKMTQNSPICAREQRLKTARLMWTSFFLCIVFKGDSCTHNFISYLPFSFLGDTLKHIVYQTVCVEFDRSSCGYYVPRVCCF